VMGECQSIGVAPGPGGPGGPAAPAAPGDPGRPWGPAAPVAPGAPGAPGVPAAARRDQWWGLFGGFFPVLANLAI
jgi:hypothetical protein